jgi:hypothetical protein
VYFHFCTAVWGPWHLGAFLGVNLPSLLAERNLPAFAARHKVLYRIFTSPADAARIKASAVFRRAERIVPFELVECVHEQPAQPIAMHHAIWRRSIDEARAAGAMVLFVPPDVVWSNGSYGHLADLAAQGKRAIFITYLRVVHETSVPEVKRRYANADATIIDAPARDLADLAMRHIHPLALTYLRHSPNFPVHPEFILWPVAGEGLSMRVLVREMFAYDPRLVDLNTQALAAHPIDPALVHHVTDSDDLFSLSLAPASQDIEWYLRPQRLEPLKVASWWLGYDSPLNDAIAAKYFRIHPVPCTPAAWRAVEQASDVLMRRMAGMREALRILSAVSDPDAEQSRRVLMMAIAATRLARMLPASDRLTILLPNNAAIMRWLLDGGDALLRPPYRMPLIDLLLDHAVLGHLADHNGQEASLTTLRGAPRRLTWREDTPLIDGVAVRPRSIEAGSHRAHLIEAVLPPLPPRRRTRN